VVYESACGQVSTEIAAEGVAKSVIAVVDHGGE